MDINDLDLTTAIDADNTGSSTVVDSNDLDKDATEPSSTTSKVAPSLYPPIYSNTQSGFEPVQMGLGGTTPITTQVDQTSTPPNVLATADETPGKTTDNTPTDRELKLFKKFHASDFDPNSSVDRKKLEQIRQSAAEVGQEDDSKIQAATYKKQYKEQQPADLQSKTQETEAEKRKRLLQSVKGMYVRTGFNQFRPAVQADLEAKTPLFMQNPNPVLRSINPYVSVDRTALKAKKATPVDQQAMDREMSAKGYQKLGPAGTRAEKGNRKERKSQFGGALGSASNFLGDLGNTLKGR
jgi:hypothetical protein